MNNKIKTNSLLLSVIYIFSTHIFATDQIDLPEEIKPLEINIELCEKIYEKIKNKKKFTINTHSGLTPKKNAIKMYTLDSPIKKKLNPIITKRKCTKSLFNSDESDKKIIYKTIFHQNYEFEADKWAFFDPFSKDDYVLIDCDDEKWNSIAKEITKKIKSNNPNIFLKIMINYINNNIETLKTLLTYKENSDGFCCRHFSTVALPIFTKVLQDDFHNFKGKIHQLSSNIINKEWESIDGHAWNVLRLEEKNNDKVIYSYWFVDVYNKCFLKIPCVLEKKLKLYYIENNNLKTKAITANNYYYQYTKNTFDKYILQNKEFPEKMELAAHKFIAKNQLF